MTYTPSDSDDDGIDDDVDAITDQSASPTEVTAPVNNSSTTTGSLATTNASGDTHSVFAPLSAGKVVAYAPGNGLSIEDPQNYASDDLALQAAFDYLDNTSAINHGVVFIPHYTSRGSNFTFEGTVSSQDNDTAISLQGYASDLTVAGSEHSLGTTLTGGQTVITLKGNVSSDNAMNNSINNLTFNFFGQDAGAIELDTIGGTVRNCTFGEIQRAALTIKGRVFNGRIHNCDFGGASSSNAHAIEFGTNTNGGGSDWGISNCSAVGDYDTIISNTTGTSSAYWNRTRITGCYIEGAHGRANIDWVSNGNLLISNTVNTFNSNGAHGLYFDGNGPLVVTGGSVEKLAGDGIKVENMAYLYLSPTIGFRDCNGDTINVVNAPNTHAVVPDPQLVDGTTSYPTGMNKIAAGTT